MRKISDRNEYVAHRARLLDKCRYMRRVMRKNPDMAAYAGGWLMHTQHRLAATRKGWFA